MALATVPTVCFGGWYPTATRVMISRKTPTYDVIVVVFGKPLALRLFLCWVNTCCFKAAVVARAELDAICWLRIIVLLPLVLLQGRLPYFVLLLAKEWGTCRPIHINYY